jgi:hypothetical protein
VYVSWNLRIDVVIVDDPSCRGMLMAAEREGSGPEEHRFITHTAESSDGQSEA